MPSLCSILRDRQADSRRAMFVYLLTGLATVAYGLYLYFTRTFNYWKSRNVPSLKPVPIFGNVKQSALRREPIMIVMRKIYNAFPDEKVAGVYSMTTPNLLIRDPDIIKQVMIKDFDYFADRGFSFDKEGLGKNLFHADEEVWRVLRNKFTPLFTSGKLKNMVPLMTDCGDNFIKYVESLTHTEPEQNVCQLVQKYTMTSIAACAFGLDIDLLKDSDTVDTLLKMDQKIFTINFAFELDMMYPGILNKLSFSLFPAEVSSFFYDLVRQVVTARNGAPTNRKDFMDLMLELKQAKEVQGTKRTENDEIRTVEVNDALMAAQAFVFYIGGYETSATTMGYLLMQLALNPDIQGKVVAEIKEVLRQHDGEITYDALKSMVYLERAFDETLRMYPIGDPLQRRALVDYKIPGTNVTLEKGQNILVCVGGLHHDEKYWPNPSKFDPDRFTPKNSADRHPAVYMPFGIGPRNCIGMRFAKVQSLVCMVKLLQRFRLEATDHTRRNFQYDPNRIVLAPLGGYKMKLLPRE